MPRLIALTCAVFVLVSGFVPQSMATVFDPQTFTLPNGMQGVVIENHRAPVVRHMVWYRVGAGDELAGKSGIAHFLEHLMFKGTGEIAPGEFSKIIARNGGRDNAFTSWDYTAYHQSVAKDRLQLVMGMEADRMRNLRLSDPVVLPERDVILEERSSRIDSQPGSMLGEQMRASLYMNHPYGRPIIGWRHEMEGLTTEDALAFYRHWYNPSNAILVVAGDVTLDEVKALAEQTYGKLPAGDKIARRWVVEPAQHAPRVVTLESPLVGQPSWRRTYLAPSYLYGATEQAYPLQVLAEIIGSGPTSRFFRSAVVEKAVASGAGAYYDADSKGPSAFTVYVVPRPGQALDAAAEVIEDEIRKLLKDGVTDEELQAAKERLQDAAIFARDSLNTGPQVIGAALAIGRTVEDVERWPDEIGQVTREQVLDAARALFVEKQSVTGYLLPKQEDASDAETQS